MPVTTMGTIFANETETMSDYEASDPDALALPLDPEDALRALLAVKPDDEDDSERDDDPDQ